MGAARNKSIKAARRANARKTHRTRPNVKSKRPNRAILGVIDSLLNDCTVSVRQMRRNVKKTAAVVRSR